MRHTVNSDCQLGLFDPEHVDPLGRARTARNRHSRFAGKQFRVVSRGQHLDIFARNDGAQALKLIAQDAVIDHEFRSIMRNLITFMMEDPRTISAALDTLWVAKAIERIGDHSKNVAEQIIYLVEGKDVRHTALEDIESAVL